MQTEVRVVEEVAAPAARVWALIRGFGDLLQWSEGIESCELTAAGSAPCARSACRAACGCRSDWSRSTRPSAASATRSSGRTPLPFRDYLSRVQLREAGPARCEITWEGSFDAKPGSEAASQKVVRGIYTGSIASLRKKLGV